MIFEWSYEVGRYVGLGPVDRNASIYDQRQLLRHKETVRNVWTHPPVELYQYDARGKRVSRGKDPSMFESDAPGDSYLSARAAAALSDLLEQYGELLPLESKDGEFFVFHCMNEIDAVDPPRCDFNGMNIVKYVFRPDVVRGQHIFRPSFPWRWPIFVSQVVVDRVKSAGLKGFKFTPVWSEETGPIVEEPPTPAIEQRRHGKTCKPMPQDTKRELEKLVGMAKKDLKIDVAADPPEKVLKRIGQEAQSAQGWANSIDEGVGISMVLGSLWGELICREFGWQWVMVDKVAAVVSATRSHVIFPHAWLHDLIRSAGRGPKLSELYDMIKSGSLPRSEPDSYLVLA